MRVSERGMHNGGGVVGSAWIGWGENDGVCGEQERGCGANGRRGICRHG